jgi:RNA polymerase sigma factor (sigma-70 family)
MLIPGVNKMSEKQYKRLSKDDEEKILKQCLIDNDWIEFTCQYYNLVKSAVIRTFINKGSLFDHDEPDEMRNEIFVHLIEKAVRKYDRKKGLSLGGWVYCISKRRTLNYIKTKRNRIKLVPIKDNKADADPFEMIIDSEDRMAEIEIILSILNAAQIILTEREKEVFLLYLLEKKKPYEIAEYLGISISAVNAALTRAKKHLLRERHLFTDLEIEYVRNLHQKM